MSDANKKVLKRTKFAGIRGASIPEKLDFYTSPDPNSGCWLWVGTWSMKGYGNLVVKGKTYRAHRLQWERFNGPIPDGLIVCHRCDTPPCVNPDHLFLGTNKDNTLDAVSKGHIGAGIINGNSKLTESQVLAIRTDGRPARIIGDAYGVGASAIQHIKTRRTWRHLT